jgi:hypothetical protein
MKKIAFYSMLFLTAPLAASPHSATQTRPPAKRPIIVLTNCGGASPEAIVRGGAAIYPSI